VNIVVGASMPELDVVLADHPPIRGIEGLPSPARHGRLHPGVSLRDDGANRRLVGIKEVPDTERAGIPEDRHIETAEYARSWQTQRPLARTPCTSSKHPPSSYSSNQ